MSSNNIKNVYLSILILGNNAFGIWRSGKLIGLSEKNQGKLWDIDYLSSLSYPDIHKHYIKKNYPNISVINFNDKRISNVPKIILDAVRKINKMVEDPSTLMFARDYYFITMNDGSPEIDTI